MPKKEESKEKKPIKRKKKKALKEIDNLIIVESPTKAKTISQFLGRKYKVESSFGHMRDLPKSRLGIDIEKNFEPDYIIPRKNQKNTTALKKTAKLAKKIILATDEDREGEAIAWHLTHLLGDKEYERIAFHEITPQAIEEALENPREINKDMVDAQQARRVLDRLVGYGLSPFLWEKIQRGLSAGRVQSVALRLITDREKEREAFKSQEYWTLEADFENDKGKVRAELSKINEEALEKFSLPENEKVEKIQKDLEDGDKSFSVINLVKKESKKSTSPPFTTSSLQQESSRKLGFSAKKTMMLAQQLYEGQKIGEKKPVGLITYMRTDSVNLAESALNSGRDTIIKEYGKEYLPEKPKKYKSKSKNAQEAHEAIRPTRPELTPDSLKEFLEAPLLKLYRLIWERFIACQMKDAIFERTTLEISGKGKKDQYIFKANGNIMKFDGFLKAYPVKVKEQELPDLSEKEKVDLKEIFPLQHFTQPPARYNEASLVKTLEENDIGRPSTYAPIVSVIQNRSYVEKDEDKRFYPTELGVKVSDLLTNHFSQIVDLDFTAKIETELDEIAAGKDKWQTIVSDFYAPFKENLDKKYKDIKKEDYEEKTDEVCDKCGKPMIVKWSRFGKFLGCSGFPECREIKKVAGRNDVDMKCPTCKEGDVITRRTKARKRLFYGCSRWPDCDFTSWKKPEEKKEED